VKNPMIKFVYDAMLNRKMYGYGSDE